jgi:hypothetical protein
MTRPCLGRPPCPRGASSPTWHLKRFLFLRGLGAIYLVAFGVAWTQQDALWGPDGLLPADRFLTRLGDNAWRVPSLFQWIGASDLALHGVIGLDLLLAVGRRAPRLRQRSDPRGVVGAVPVRRERRAGLHRVRVGVAAARDGVPGDLPRACPRRPAAPRRKSAADGGDLAPALDARAGHSRGRPHQAAWGSVLDGAHLPRLVLRNPTRAASAVLVLAPSAIRTARRWRTAEPSRRDPVGPARVRTASAPHHCRRRAGHVPGSARGGREPLEMFDWK